MKRIRAADDAFKGSGNYFADPKSEMQFIPTGCKLLDCVIGGGWALGRITNVVGDNSTGKTLLAIEGAANCAAIYPKAKIWYREAESAFNKSYAGALGMPLERVDFGKRRFDTVEDIFEDLTDKIVWSKEYNQPGLYIIDSLDALSNRVEKKRKIDADSFKTEKSRLMNELFRRQTQDIEESKIALVVISQTRTKIGLSFGDKKTRSGAGAMDFYASVILYLSHLKTLNRTIDKVKRATGIRIKAKCKKNKISLPMRSCEFKIDFGFGIDDVEASVEWLYEVGRLSDIGLTKKTIDDYLDEVAELDSAGYRARQAELGPIVQRAWSEIETKFLPTRSKYGA